MNTYLTEYNNTSKMVIKQILVPLFNRWCLCFCIDLGKNMHQQIHKLGISASYLDKDTLEKRQITLACLDFHKKLKKLQQIEHELMQSWWDPLKFDFKPPKISVDVKNDNLDLSHDAKNIRSHKTQCSSVTFELNPLNFKNCIAFSWLR